MIARITQTNETLAVCLTKAFGTMWICYAFMVYGLLPAFAIFHPYQDSFLYWSNWVQLWSLPLILVGTNILGREAEKRSKLDHEKLAKSYEEQQQTPSRKPNSTANGGNPNNEDDGPEDGSYRVHIFFVPMRYWG